MINLSSFFLLNGYTEYPALWDFLHSVQTLRDKKSEALSCTQHAQKLFWSEALSPFSLLVIKSIIDSFYFYQRTFPCFTNIGEVKYAPSMYDPDFVVTKADKNIKVELKNEVSGLDIYYSFDNSYPDRFYPKYTEALTIPKEATQLKVITYRGKEPVGRMISMPVSELEKRVE